MGTFDYVFEQGLGLSFLACFRVWYRGLYRGPGWPYFTLVVALAPIVHTLMADLFAISRTCVSFIYTIRRLARYLSHLRHFHIPRWPFCLLFVALAPLLHSTINVLYAICRSCADFASNEWANNLGLNFCIF